MSMTSFISLGDLKAWLKITTSDGDDVLTALTLAASQALIDVMNGDPRSVTVTENYNGTASQKLVVNNFPVTDVSAVSLICRGAQAASVVPIALTEIIWGDCTIMWTQGVFPKGMKNIQVSYTGGLASTDLTSVQLAVKMTAKAMWEAISSSMNVSSESFSGVMSQSYWPSGPGAVPPAARLLVANYIRKFSAT